MRSFFIALTSLILFTAGTAEAKVNITIDKDNQQMTVSVDGVQRYRWPVSTGIPSRETPSGTFHAFRMEEDYYSKEFDDAPMPHAIFFTKIGHAIHGTMSEGQLGTPASHGCVRLSRANASTLYALVQQQGVLSTSVTLTGSARVAMARNPRRNAARGAVQPNEEYEAARGPVDLSPGRRYAPPAQDDGYIYPADGSSDTARYPAPRRLFGGQAYPRQYQYYDQGQNQGYVGQGYYYQPRQYNQPRGYYDYQE